MRLTERTGRVAGPEQIRLGGVGHGLQVPGAGRLGVVAIVKRRQMDRSRPLPAQWQGRCRCRCRCQDRGLHRPCHPGRQRADAEDEFARAAGQHDAFDRDLMKSGQGLAQRLIVRVGIAGRIGRLDRRQRGRTGSAGVAVGREIEARHAEGVGAAVQPDGFSHAGLRWLATDLTATNQANQAATFA